MKNKLIKMLFIILISLGLFSTGNAFDQTTEDIIWSERNAQGEVNVHLYVYWSLVCPHCEKALPYVKQLSEDNPWLKLHLREVSKNQDHLVSLYETAQKLDEPTGGEVPAFFFCGLMYTGYGENETTGQWIKDTLFECRDQFQD